MTPDGIYFADTGSERRAVQEFRFMRWVRDRKLHYPSADYESKRLPLPDDAHAKVIYVQQGQEIVATSRLCHQGLGPYSPRQLEVFAPESLGPLQEAAILDAVAFPRCSSPRAFQECVIRMLRFALQYIGQHRICSLFTCCGSSEVALYRSLGFRLYKQNHISLEAGLLVPLVLFLWDIEHLHLLDSPLLGAYAPPTHTPSNPPEKRASLLCPTP